MSYSVKTVPRFERNLKKLNQKYPSLKTEYTKLVQSLRQNPEQGTPLGKNCYKIRLSIASKGKGKSGGARVITNFVVYSGIVYLLAIYDKSKKENLTTTEMKELLKSIPK